MATRTPQTGVISSKLRMLRRLQVTLITSTVVCELGLETVTLRHQSPWTLWQSGVTAFAVYVALVGHFFGGKLIRALEQTFASGVLVPNAVQKWQTGQLLRLSAGGAFSCYGVLLRIMGTAVWQVAPLYAASLVLLLLWMPRLPLQSLSD